MALRVFSEVCGLAWWHCLMSFKIWFSSLHFSPSWSSQSSLEQMVELLYVMKEQLLARKSTLCSIPIPFLVLSVSLFLINRQVVGWEQLQFFSISATTNLTQQIWSFLATGVINFGEHRQVCIYNVLYLITRNNINCFIDGDCYQKLKDEEQESRELWVQLKSLLPGNYAATNLAFLCVT